MMLEFTVRLREAQASRRSVLCVGLDPDPRRLPPSLLDRYPLADAVVAFNAAIVEATAEAACAYKLNFAFYEALGPEGYGALERSRRLLPAGTLAVADAKRGDIGNTARFYAEAIYERLGFDACTVAPYMGRDAVMPFLEHAGRCTFVLARTSNPSAADFQEHECGDGPLYERVARHVAGWHEEAPGTAGLVVGATGPEALGRLRQLCPTLPFLIPGIGAQGGDPDALGAAATDDGSILVNSSRSILYASEGPDFAEAAAEAAETLRERLAQATGSA